MRTCNARRTRTTCQRQPAPFMSLLPRAAWSDSLGNGGALAPSDRARFIDCTIGRAWRSGGSSLCRFRVGARGWAPQLAAAAAESPRESPPPSKRAQPSETVPARPTTAPATKTASGARSVAFFIPFLNLSLCVLVVLGVVQRPRIDTPLTHPSAPHIPYSPRHQQRNSQCVCSEPSAPLRYTYFLLFLQNACDISVVDSNSAQARLLLFAIIASELKKSSVRKEKCPLPYLKRYRSLSALRCGRARLARDGRKPYEQRRSDQDLARARTHARGSSSVAVSKVSSGAGLREASGRRTPTAGRPDGRRGGGGRCARCGATSVALRHFTAAPLSPRRRRRRRRPPRGRQPRSAKRGQTPPRTDNCCSVKHRYYNRWLARSAHPGASEAPRIRRDSKSETQGETWSLHNTRTRSLHSLPPRRAQQ